MAAARTYRRLTRSFVGVTALSTLWEAEDHLLLVRSRGMFESYTRYSLRDIRAFVVTHSERRLVWNWVWGGLAALTLIWVAVQAYEGTVPIAPGVLLALQLGALVINLARGPTSNVFLNTRLGYVKLPVYRLRGARRLIDRLKPRILAAQADLVGDAATLPVAAPPLA
jgi:hypothetical protein